MVGIIGTEIDALCRVYEDAYNNVKVYPIDDDPFSLLSQDDLLYADFSYVVDDEDNSVCLLLTYSTILTKADEKIDQDELDCAILEKSINALMRYMIVEASVCIPLFQFVCGVLDAYKK